MIRNRKTKKIESEEKLLSLVNSNNITPYAQYFGNSKTPARVKVTEIDYEGFTITYIEQEEQEYVKRELRIQFSIPAAQQNELLEKMTEMLNEANMSLGMRPDKSYVSPNISKSLFVMPSIYVTITAIVIWGILGYLAFVKNVHPRLLPLLEVLHGRAGVENAILAVCILHLVEVFIVTGFGIWASFPIHVIILYAFATFFIGMATMKDGIKAAHRHRLELSTNEKIK